MMRFVALAVVAGLMLSGCTQPADDEERDEGGAIGPVVTPLDIATDPSDCQVGGLILPTPFDELAPHLPPGFTPRDVQAMLGTPVAVGQGGLAVFHLDCAASLLGTGFQTGEVLIIVNPPDINATLSPTTVDLYAIGMHVAPGPLHDLLAGAGWDIIEGEGALQIGMVAAAATLDVSFTDTNGTDQWTFGTTTPAQVALANFERIWYETPSGLSFIENDYAVDGFVGPAQCSFGPDSRITEVVGRTSCQPGDVGAAVPAAAWSARVVTLPGVRAA